MKRKTRAIISLLLVVVLLGSALPSTSLRCATEVLSTAFGSLFPIASAADQEGTCGDSLSWSLDVKSGTLTISGSGNMYDYKTVDDLSPWREGGWWHLIRSIVIKEGVTRIGDCSFTSFTNLQSASIPSSVTEIGSLAFSGCYALKNIQFAENAALQRIGSSAFTSCGFVEIALPENTSVIESLAFDGVKLRQLRLPYAVSFIASRSIEKSVPLLGYAGSAAEDYAKVNGNPFTIIPLEPGESHIAWSLSGDMRTLSIHGIGAIPDYPSSEKTPWHNYMSFVYTVRVENGIVSVGNNAFGGCTLLKSVELAPSITRIGEKAFYGCPYLESVHLPVQLTEIGYKAFGLCASLKQIEIPDSVVSIGTGAFGSCLSLEQVTLPDGLTQINDWLFSACGELKEIKLPVSVREIGKVAFDQCRKLEFVRIPSSVETIRQAALYDCTALKKVLIPPAAAVEDVAGFKKTGTTIYTENTFLCSLCEANGVAFVRVPCVSGTIDDSITWRFNYDNGTLLLDGAGTVPAFSSAERTPWATLLPFIETIQIGAEIAAIGKNVFFGCERCQAAIFLSGDTIFDAQSFSQNVHVFAPAASAVSSQAQQFSLPFTIHQQSGTFGNITWTVDTFSQTLSILGSGNIPSATSASDVPWFLYAQSITQVDITQGVTQIGSFVFACCENTHRFSVPSSVLQIGEYAFPDGSLIIAEMDSAAQRYAEENGNPFLSQVIRGMCGDSLTWTIQTQIRMLTISGTGQMPDFAEASDAPWSAYNRSFDSVIFLFGVTSVGENAFTGDLFLHRITLPETITEIRAAAFKGCSSLYDVEFSDGLKQIGENAFADCSSLMAVKIPATVLSLDDQAFSCCTSMKHCSFAEDALLTTIGPYAFSNCTGLEELSFPSRLQSIGDGAFSYCSSLQTLSMQKARFLSEIPSLCFRSCRFLTKVLFPDSLLMIGERAFLLCTQMKEVSIPSSVRFVKRLAFSSCDVLFDAWIFGRDTQLDTGSFEPIATIHAPTDSFAQRYALQNGNRFMPVQYEGDCGERARWSYNPQDDILTLSSAQEDTRAMVSMAAWQSVINTPSTVYVFPDIAEIKDGIFSAASTLYGDPGTEAEAYAVRNQLTFHSRQVKGICGAQLHWTIDLFTNVLSITGSGDMTDWSSINDVPWHRWRNRIQSVIVENGVASLGSFSFHGIQIKTLLLPESVRKIGTGAVDSSVALYGMSLSAVQTWAEQNGSTFYALDVFDVNKLTLLNHLDEQHPAKFTFVPEESRYYLLYSQGETDTQLQVLDAKGQLVGMDNNSGEKDNFSLRLFLQAGQTYQIIVTTEDKEAARVLISFYALYTIKYNANGGTGAPETQEKQHGLHLDLSPQTPERKDCVFKGWATTASSRTAQYGKGGCLDKDRDLILYAVWGSTKTVSIQSLTYSFDNTADSFSYGLDYKIPLSIYSLLFGNTVKARGLYQNQAEWRGNCFGISCTSSMLNNPLSSVQIEDFNQSCHNSIQLNLNDYNNQLKLDLRSFIEVMQISQKSTLICNETEANKNRLSDLAALVEDIERTGEAVVISVCRVLPSGSYFGHALTGYALKRLSRYESRLYVYDSYYPGEERYITLQTDHNGKPIGWCYKTSLSELSSAEDDCYITFVPYRYYNEVWENRGSEMEERTGSLVVNASSYSIWDDSGQMIASCQNGVFTSNMDSVYMATYISGDQDVYSSGEIILPTGNYTIRNEEKALEWFEVQMIHYNLGAQVRTTSNEVKVAVDDTTNTNFVSIPPQHSEQYDMTLLSSTETDYEQVRLTGKSEGNSVSLSQSEGDIMLTNAAGADLYINEEKRTHTKDDIVSVTIKTEAEKTVYHFRESSEPDLTGLSVSVQYNDGIVEVVNDPTQFHASAINTYKHGKQRITVVWQTKSVEYTVQVKLTIWQRILMFFFGWLIR